MKMKYFNGVEYYDTDVVDLLFEVFGDDDDRFDVKSSAKFETFEFSAAANFLERANQRAKSLYLPGQYRKFIFTQKQMSNALENEDFVEILNLFKRFVAVTSAIAILAKDSKAAAKTYKSLAGRVQISNFRKAISLLSCGYFRKISKYEAWVHHIDSKYKYFELLLSNINVIWSPIGKYLFDNRNIHDVALSLLGIHDKLFRVRATNWRDVVRLYDYLERKHEDCFLYSWMTRKIEDVLLQHFRACHTDTQIRYFLDSLPETIRLVFLNSNTIKHFLEHVSPSTALPFVKYVSSENSERIADLLCKRFSRMVVKAYHKQTKCLNEKYRNCLLLDNQRLLNVLNNTDKTVFHYLLSTLFNHAPEARYSLYQIISNKYWNAFDPTVSAYFYVTCFKNVKNVSFLNFDTQPLSLDFSNYQGDEDILLTLKSLLSDYDKVKVKHLKLSNCHIDRERYSKLASLIRPSMLRYLNMSSNPVGRLSMIELIEKLKENEKDYLPLTLKMKNCDITVANESMYHHQVGGFVRRHKHDFELRLSHNYFAHFDPSIDQVIREPVFDAPRKKSYKMIPAIIGDKLVSPQNWIVSLLGTCTTSFTDFGHAYILIEGMEHDGNRWIYLADLVTGNAENNNKPNVRVLSTRYPSLKGVKAHYSGKVKGPQTEVRGDRKVDVLFLRKLRMKTIGSQNKKFEAASILASGNSIAIVEDIISNIESEKKDGLDNPYAMLSNYRSDAQYDKGSPLNCVTWALFHLKPLLPENFSKDSWFQKPEDTVKALKDCIEPPETDFRAAV